MIAEINPTCHAYGQLIHPPEPDYGLRTCRLQLLEMPQGNLRPLYKEIGKP